MVGLNILFFSWRVAKPLPDPPAPPEISQSVHVNRLLLLSELEKDALRSRSVVERGIGRVGDDPESSCFRVGPLDTPEIVADVQAWLEDNGASTRVKRGERRELALYWIFLPPQGNRDSAVERVLAMRESGIEDISIISRGDMANAISLGVYSRRASLDRRLAELQGKGHEPSVSPRYRTKKAAWLEAVFSKDSGFPGDEFQQAFADTKVEDAPCVSDDSSQSPATTAAAVSAGEVATDASGAPATGTDDVDTAKEPPKNAPKDDKPAEKPTDPFPDT